jgi:tetratricopeptide (TPR) repeat protein
VRRHADAIEYDAFRVPGLLLEAWVAGRRHDGAAAVDRYRRALELAGRIGFGDHAAFAFCAVGSIALANGDLHEAEELQRQALATAEAADATWVAAHARVQLGRVAAATGDADTAESLYHRVLDWSQLQRPHQARESLFVALAGSPPTAALLGLAEIAERRGDTASADELRARAGLALT